MITRREFLKISALTLAVAITPEGYKIFRAEEVPSQINPNLWIELSKDNYLTVLINKSEMGQGVYTGLSMIVADELDFPWERVRAKASPAGKLYIDPKMKEQLTGGSTSVRNMYFVLRKAGASMREMLLFAASKKLGIPKKDLLAKGGFIIEKKTGKKHPYAEFLEEAKNIPLPKEPPLKKPEEFIYIGRSLPRLDTEEKINGKALFGIDAKIKGMLYAVVERPPYFGGKPLKVDKSDALKVPGVYDVFPISTGVAICGDSFWACEKARDKIKIKWSESPLMNWNDEDFEKFFLHKLKEKGVVVKKTGDPERVFKNSEIVLENTYLLPYLYHATLEPMSTLVWVKKEECHIYVPTQWQTSVIRSAEKITGLPEEKIKVYTTYLGGGFGRKANVEFVEEALEISKKTGKPVKLIYTREDDIKSGYFRPMNAAFIKASADKKGNLTALSFKIAVQPLLGGRASVEGLENMLYHIPNLYVERVDVDLPVTYWFWRSVGSTHNAFILETFLDKMAKLMKIDPVDLRLNLLKREPIARRVVERAAEISSWGKTPRKGAVMGFAYHYSFGTHVAEVAEVILDEKTGKIKVPKVYCVIDHGPVTVHPDLIKSQMEGAICMGLSMALKEAVRFEKGGVKNTNFHTYEILKFEEAPEVEVEILNSQRPMGGVGEPGLPPIAPAVANALFWGYGLNITRLPLTPEYVKTLLTRKG